mgnify:CR=1 FL=1
MRVPSDADLRRELVEFRENVLIPAGLGPREKGLLRRAMMDLLVEHKPTNKAAFQNAIPSSLITATTQAELERYLTKVINITRKFLVERFQRALGAGKTRSLPVVSAYLEARQDADPLRKLRPGPH